MKTKIILWHIQDIEYYSALKRSNIKPWKYMEETYMHIAMKEASLKGLHTVGVQLHDILEKA